MIRRASIIRFVHELSHELNAHTPNTALPQWCLYVRLGYFQRVERTSIVLYFRDKHAPFNRKLDTNLVYAVISVPVLDDVRQHLIQCDLQVSCNVRRKLIRRRKPVDSRYNPRELTRSVVNGNRDAGHRCERQASAAMSSEGSAAPANSRTSRSTAEIRS